MSGSLMAHPTRTTAAPTSRWSSAASERTSRPARGCEDGGRASGSREWGGVVPEERLSCRYAVHRPQILVQPFEDLADQIVPEPQVHVAAVEEHVPLVLFGRAE